MQSMRDEFWDTQPHYGGSQSKPIRVQHYCIVVLKAAYHNGLDSCAACREQLSGMHSRQPVKQTSTFPGRLWESAGIVVATDDMTVCYDERGIALRASLALFFAGTHTYAHAMLSIPCMYAEICEASYSAHM